MKRMIDMGKKIKQILNNSNTALINKGLRAADSLSGVYDEVSKNEINRISYAITREILELNEDDFGNGDIGESAFMYCTKLKNVVIPNSVTKIKSHAFEYCSSLTSITIPNSVTSIDGYAFNLCSNLEKVYASDIESWAKINFFHEFSNPMSYAEELYFNNELVTQITIPDSVTSIGTYAFCNCSNSTNITIPDSVTSIGTGAFYGWSNLTSITLPFVGSSRTASSSYDAVFGYIFGYTSSYESGTIGQYYNTNRSYYYYIPSTLRSVTITDGTTIPYCAFYNCSMLIEINLPKNVTSIGSYAFSNCTGLTNITIPDGVISIGDYAFYNCKNLTCIYLKPVIPPTLIAKNAIPSATTIHVPVGSGEAYKSATNWSSYTIVEDIEV